MTGRDEHGFDDEPRHEPSRADGQGNAGGGGNSRRTRTIDVESELKTWAPLLHLSLLSHFVLPGIGGVVAPIVIWLVKKNDLPEIDPHGRVVVNAMISSLIYSVVLSIVIFLLFVSVVGVLAIPLMIVAAFVISIFAIVFPIVGAIKASNGEVWPYPLCIPFL